MVSHPSPEERRWVSTGGCLRARGEKVGEQGKRFEDMNGKGSVSGMEAGVAVV